MNPILITTENALYNVATSSIQMNGLTASVFLGIGNQDKDGPAVICMAESATEDFPESGIWRVKTSVKVREIASDTASGSIGNLSGAIFGSFLTSSAITILNQYPGYYVFDCFITDTADRENLDAWEHELTFETVCCLTPFQ